MPTHHLAFETLFQLKHAAPNTDFFVAECDIQKFYDTVHHGIALDCLERLLQVLQASNPTLQLHPRAAHILRAYLDCYSFPRNVLAESQRDLQAEHSQGVFPWPAEALLKHYSNPHSEAIGVPQGGAISCIISNIVLDLADKRVKAVALELGAEVHYFRYCDDMILLARNELHCQQFFQTYLAALNELKLPYHDPNNVRHYDKQFWKEKSKNSYCWTGRKGPGCVPWIQFVGYQVRYDRLVRIKNQSIRKHLMKLRNVTDHLKFGLLGKRRDGTRGRRIKATKDQVMLSLEWKLASRGVGRVNLQAGKEGPRRMCWAGGYKALHDKPLVPAFLKRLDRQREQQLRRMDQATITYGRGAPSHHQGKGSRPDPIGLPFSYLGQFHNSGGRELISRPYKPWFQRFVSHPLYLAVHPNKLRKKARRWFQAACPPIP